jgi:hypothetical protein
MKLSKQLSIIRETAWNHDLEISSVKRISRMPVRSVIKNTKPRTYAYAIEFSKDSEIVHTRVFKYCNPDQLRGYSGRAIELFEDELEIMFPTPKFTETIIG